jgi:hypothetical protein
MNKDAGLDWLIHLRAKTWRYFFEGRMGVGGLPPDVHAKHLHLLRTHCPSLARPWQSIRLFFPFKLFPLVGSSRSEAASVHHLFPSGRFHQSFLKTNMHFSTLLAGLGLLSTTGWAQYTLQDDYLYGGNFFDQFTFYTSSDPTHGFVQYQSQSAAQSAGLISSSTTNVQMKVDSTSVTPSGRPSVRITSNKSYNTGLFIVDIEHMPGGICGTWPAFWLVGPNWPDEGEIGKPILLARTQSIAKNPRTSSRVQTSRPRTT